MVAGPSNAEQPKPGRNGRKNGRTSIRSLVADPDFLSTGLEQRVAKKGKR